ncbi:LacI family DNA-binding transcriptional regulator, partial [Mycoplasmopsis bovis]|uniref:LacI family DNA-binding transcriptional regulator n=1 Tax=Mycoplasmopsis bovis TaxID=28903 RepID=UPI003D2A148C
MKNFSYKDIARLAHVSISTVSRFYNGGYVSKQTKSRIAFWLLLGKKKITA